MVKFIEIRKNWMPIKMKEMDSKEGSTVQTW